MPLCNGSYAVQVLMAWQMQRATESSSLARGCKVCLCVPVCACVCTCVHVCACVCHIVATKFLTIVL